MDGMQLIFLSTMEQKTEEERSKTAQVTITEHQGAWRVMWSEETVDGKPLQDCWYEGDGWKDMLHCFREGLKVKRSSGYFPLVDSSLPGGLEDGRKRDVLILQYYGEMNYVEPVFQELRAWRRQTANKEGKSAFFIATNRMLFMLSAFLPQTLDEVKGIPGFGQRKAEIYGEAILRITSKVERQTGFPLDWVQGVVSQEDFEAWILEQQRSKEQQEQMKSQQRRQVLEGASAGTALAELEAGTGMKRQEIVRLVEELDREGYDMSPLVDAELAGADENETARIMELFGKLGVRFLKPVLQGLYTEEERKNADVNELYEKLRLHRIRFKAKSSRVDSKAEQPAV
jgi:hypothetical protein